MLGLGGADQAHSRNRGQVRQLVPGTTCDRAAGNQREAPTGQALIDQPCLQKREHPFGSTPNGLGQLPAAVWQTRSQHELGHGAASLDRPHKRVEVLVRIDVLSSRRHDIGRAWTSGTGERTDPCGHRNNGILGRKPPDSQHPAI
jgi:hypothetical protein